MLTGSFYIRRDVMIETIVISEFNFQKMVAASDGIVTSLYVNHERLQP